MYRANVHTKKVISNICNQLKHIPSKAVVAQWIHQFSGGCRISRGRAPVFIDLKSIVFLSEF